MTTEVLTIEENGKLTLPDDITERYQFKKEMCFRIIETQKGILLIPLTSQQDALRFSGTILIEPDANNHLRQPSVALVF